MIVNPKLDFGCADWCQYAERCVGVVPEEVKARQKGEEKDSLRERISLEMKKYLGGDLKRVNHALKVARHAEEILKMEGGNPLVVLGAAYLHDIGIHEAEKMLFVKRFDPLSANKIDPLNFSSSQVCS